MVFKNYRKKSQFLAMATMSCFDTWQFLAKNCHGQKLPWPKIAIVLIEFRIHLTVCLAQHFFKHSRNLHIKYLLIVQKIRLFVTSPKEKKNSKYNVIFHKLIHEKYEKLIFHVCLLSSKAWNRKKCFVMHFT